MLVNLLAQFLDSADELASFFIDTKNFVNNLGVQLFSGNRFFETSGVVANVFDVQHMALFYNVRGRDRRKWTEDR